MELNLSLESIEEQLSRLSQLVQSSSSLLQISSIGLIDSSYSSIPGFDVLGENHGKILYGGAGSATEILQSFSDQILWIAEQLQITLKALSRQEGFTRSGLSIADEGGSVGNEHVEFRKRPDARYTSFDFEVPVVGKSGSLSELSSAFWQTNHAAVGQSMEHWNQLGTHVQTIANDLRSIAQSIASSNRGQVIDAAVARINEVATHGDAFASSVPGISGALGNLLSSVPFLQMKLMQAQTAVAAVEEPAEKRALEEEYLGSFQTELQDIADRAVPSTRNLMQNVVAGQSAGGSANTGMGSIAGNGRLSTGGLGAAGMQQTSGTAAAMAGPGEFAAVNDQVAALQGISPEAMSTHAASAGGLGPIAPGFGTSGMSLGGLNTAGLAGGATAPGSTGAGAYTPGAFGGVGTSGISAGSFGSTPSFASPGALSSSRLGTTPAGAGSVATPSASAERFGTSGGVGVAPIGGIGARGGLGGLPGATGFGGASTTPGYAGGMPARGSSGAGAGSSRHSGAATPTVAGIGRVGAGGYSTTGGGGTGGRISATPAGVIPTAAGGAGAGQQAGAGRGPGAMMGGMPMAGTSGETKKGKMRRLTTTIEGDDNVSALLGEKTPAVPGVIGAWVRG